jgi:hypothetical protein
MTTITMLLAMMIAFPNQGLTRLSSHPSSLACPALRWNQAGGLARARAFLGRTQGGWPGGCGGSAPRRHRPRRRRLALAARDPAMDEFAAYDALACAACR